MKTDVTPPAVGDGRADDTAAIQAALDLGRHSKAVYIPPGTYRITRTLVFEGPAVGCLVIGHGRDTRLVWDGPQGGRMFWSNGVAYSRYVGLSWDGQGKAAVGFDHAAQQRFETETDWGTISSNPSFPLLGSLESEAGIYEAVYGLHRKLAERFPFAIYYRVADPVIDVVAILDCGRDPDAIARRLVAPHPA